MNPLPVDVEAGKTYWWCRCGLAAQQPFCDGSHKGGDSSPLKFTPVHGGRIWLCACKRTATPPYCDGSHAREAAGRADAAPRTK